MHVDSKTDRLAPSKHVKLGHSLPARKIPSKKRFAGGPIVARDLVLAVCKLALYDTCSSDIHPEAIYIGVYCFEYTCS